MAIGAESNPVGYDELLSTTIQKIEGQLVDQVLEQHPTLEIFKGMVSAGIGPSIIVPVRGSLLGRTAVSNARGEFNTGEDNELAGTAQYDFSNPIVTPTSIAFKTLALNEGANKVVDIMKMHIQAATDDHAVALASAFHGSGSASGAFNSIPDLVSASGTVGGIDPTGTATWWKATEITSSAAAEDIRVGFRRLSNGVLDASGRVGDILLVGADVFDEYENSLDDSVRYNALGVGDTRFSELKFNGLTIRRDGTDAPVDTAYLLNKNSWIVRSLAGHFMKANPSQNIQGSLTSVTPFSTMLAVGVTERRANGKLTRTA